MNIHLDRKPFYPTRHSHKHYNRNVYTGQDKAKQNYVNTYFSDIELQKIQGIHYNVTYECL